MKKTSFAPRVIPLNEVKLWQADKRLLPSYLFPSDNSRRIRHYKKAARHAIDTLLTEKQREQLLLHYGEQLSKTQIALRYGVGSSAVCKVLKTAEETVKKYVETYMQIYDGLEREFENDIESECYGG